MRVLFVRHGETAERAPGDIALSPAGRVMAGEVAATLRDRPGEIAAVVSSPLLRAVETATIIGEVIGVAPSVDDRLPERSNWGDLAEQSFDDFVADWIRCEEDRDHVPDAPLAKSSREAGRGVDSLVAELAERFGADAAVVLVAHGGILVDYLRNQMERDALSADDGVSLGAAPAYCSLSEWEVRPDGSVHISTFAEAGHLTERRVVRDD